MLRCLSLEPCRYDKPAAAAELVPNLSFAYDTGWRQKEILYSNFFLDTLDLSDCQFEGRVVWTGKQLPVTLLSETLITPGISLRRSRIGLALPPARPHNLSTVHSTHQVTCYTLSECRHSTCSSCIKEFRFQKCIIAHSEDITLDKFQLNIILGSMQIFVRIALILIWNVKLEWTLGFKFQKSIVFNGWKK